MKQYQTSSDLKNTAKECLAGKYGSAAGITVAFFTVSFAIGFVLVFCVSLFFLSIVGNTETFGSKLIMYLLSGACSILAGVLNSGMALFYLNIACGQRFSVRDLFYCFSTDFHKALLISAAMTLPEIICLLPYNIFVHLYESTSNPFWAVLVLASAVLGLVIYIPITLGLSMSFYLMLDFPQYSTKQILGRSFQLMKGHKGRLFYIQLSFLPLLFLCTLTFGIGYLWIAPYAQMTQALFFLDLMNPRQS